MKTIKYKIEGENRIFEETEKNAIKHLSFYVQTDALRSPILRKFDKDGKELSQAQVNSKSKKIDLIKMFELNDNLTQIKEPKIKK